MANIAILLSRLTKVLLDHPTLLSVILGISTREFFGVRAVPG